MDRQEAIVRLPEVYVTALRLRDRGIPDDRIAELLDIHSDAVNSFFDLAESKLAALMAEPPPQRYEVQKPNPPVR